ncbi:MAG: ORF6N domain-containing protein [Desulfobacteraceae bacterium]|nr:MAG: ORF6N domain-containing protein [Desulfobacteraceae bacterium]
MLDRDLAELYEVTTKALKQAVKRNADRFPDDFMFILNRTEFTNWRSQFVTSNSDRMGLRHSPMAFTEQGVAMISSVLNSPRAIQVNIAIMRAFVQLRTILSTHADLRKCRQSAPDFGRFIKRIVCKPGNPADMSINYKFMIVTA